MLRVLLFLFVTLSVFSKDISGYKKSILNEREVYKKNKIKSAHIFLSDSVLNPKNKQLFEAIFYDKEGKTTIDSIYQMAEDPQSIPYYKYSYDSNGDVERYDMMNFDIEVLYHEYVIDEDGKPSGSSFRSADPKRYDYKYNEKGYLTQLDSYSYYFSADDSVQNTPWVNNQKEVYTYDKQNNQISIEYQKLDFSAESEKWITDYKVNKTYNKKNILQKEEYINNENVVYLTKVYNYSKNNLIKSIYLLSKFDQSKYLHYSYEYYAK
jgi:hypothetical protein